MPKLSLAKLERHLYGAADILRREGMDAATYKDFIFGMLFLKRCSDVFEPAYEKIVSRKVTQGMSREDAEANYGENPDFYDEFFVPGRARWSHLQSKLNDASEPFGAVLDKALAALSEANESLQHVLDHIQFMKVQSNKRIVSDEACKELVRHFNRYRLRSEDFQFSDLLGSAYEFLINMFAESAGKKGGDFYTPRDVIRLMVRVLNPTPGMSIYDPTCGSGGMLIISREYIEQSGGDPTNLRLCGQVNDASAWSICKINMLLHSIRGSDIRLEDTLLHPLHREGGELERFDRVIANPPFSQNYTKSNMEFPERYRWGWCPTSGKKADLMFAQHMLAVCKPGGMVATVMPHGVLFRGGAEKEIRRKFLQQDLIEAIISLPQNLFYGASIPACILIMRSNITGQALNPNKPENRRGKVLFINADAEYLAGRAQNYLRPEDIEKVASTFECYAEVPGYSKIVTFDEIVDGANDFNLNVRRYVDNSPLPEPHDVRAHLAGGIPVAEIESNRALFEALGFSPDVLFAHRPNEERYRDFKSSISERPAIARLIEADAGLLARTGALKDALTEWWASQTASLVALPHGRNLNAVRSEFLRGFTEALLQLGVLNNFKLSGVVAAWWTETLPDFKTLIENSFCGVVDGWVDAIADAVEDDDNVGPAFDPFCHKLVKRTMADYLQRIDDAKSEIARLKGEKEAFEQSNPPDDADDEDLASWNYAKDLERQVKELKAEFKDVIKELTRLEKAATKKKATDADRRAAEAARRELQPYFDQMAVLEMELAPYEQIKTDLAAARATFRALTNAFVDELKSRCAAMAEDEKQELVLELFAQDLQSGLDGAVRDKQQELTRFAENLWDKYARSLSVLTETREKISILLKGKLNKMPVYNSDGIEETASNESDGDWQKMPLSSVADIRFSSVNKVSLPGEDPVRLCNYIDVYNNDYVTKDMDFMRATATKSEIDRFRLQVGDVIITKDSEKPDDIGIPTVVDSTASDLVCGYHLALLRLNQAEVDPTFLSKQLAHHRIARYFGQQANGTTRYGLSAAAIANTPLHLPRPESQKAASSLMRMLDEHINQSEAVIEKLKRLRAGLQEDLLSGSASAPEPSEGGSTEE